MDATCYWWGDDGGGGWWGGRWLWWLAGAMIVVVMVGRGCRAAAPMIRLRDLREGCVVALLY